VEDELTNKRSERKASSRPKRSVNQAKAGRTKLEPKAGEIVEVLPPDKTPRIKKTNSRKRTSSSEDLVRYDPLVTYLREVRQYPRLTVEEEQDLALRYYRDQDLEAAYKLVSSNLWLVVKIAREFERAARSVLDLIQEGNIGLMEAVKNFDPFRGTRFPSYASWWIRAYIIRFVIANWRMVKIGTTQAQRKLFFNLQKEKDKLERAGFYPGAKLLAEKLDVRESDVIEMESRLALPDLSVDAPLRDGEDADYHSVLPTGQDNAEQILGKEEMKRLIDDGLKRFTETLNEKERTILSRRMINEEKQTLQELSDELSISKERVRQIENAVREKLRQFFLKEYGAAVEGMAFD
jgi:RNA polymerase sigma-32 factor